MLRIINFRSALLLVCILLSFRATAREKSQIYAFRLDPVGTVVAFVDMNSDDIKKCVSPCELSLKSGADGYFLFDKDGYAMMVAGMKAAKTIDGVPTFTTVMTTIEDIEKDHKLQKVAIQPPSGQHSKCDSKNDPKKFNQAPVPCLRISPSMPPKFMDSDFSGYCRVRYDVDKMGHVFNVKAVKCTNDVLERPAIGAVQKWKYFPGRRNGNAVNYSGVEVYINFQVYDHRGNPQPYPEE